MLARCHRFLVIPTRHCTNLSAAVYTVLYDRHAKRVQSGLESRNSVSSSVNNLSSPSSFYDPSDPGSPSEFNEPESMAPATGLTWPR
jgi:hypothetical protein